MLAHRELHQSQEPFCSDHNLIKAPYSVSVIPVATRSTQRDMDCWNGAKACWNADIAEGVPSTT